MERVFVTFNLPISDILSPYTNILIAGMGGGFDIFCGLPIRQELRRQGKTVHLANLSFTRTEFIKDTIALAPGVSGIHADCRSVLLYSPELYLVRHLRETEGDAAPIWAFSGEVAVQPLLQSYRALIAHLKPEAILLVDGGVDSLIRGDEKEVGSVFEDAVSLAAVSQLTEAPIRIMACLGMGAEPDITHAHVLENIAALTKEGGFLGASALTPQMPAYQVYEDAVTFVHGQRGQDPSIIHSSVSSAVRGNFGDYHSVERTRGNRLYLSPLMSLYWFFDLPKVAERCLFVPELIRTQTRREALQAITTIRHLIPHRSTASHIQFP